MIIRKDQLEGKFLYSAALTLDCSFNWYQSHLRIHELIIVYFMNSVLIWLKHLIKIKIEQLKFGIYLYKIDG